MSMTKTILIIGPDLATQNRLPELAIFVLIVKYCYVSLGMHKDYNCTPSFVYILSPFGLTIYFIYEFSTLYLYF